MTEVLLTQSGVKQDEKLALLACMANLYEVAQWMRPNDPQADLLGRRLLDATAGCDRRLTPECADAGLEFLDQWYSNAWD